MIIFKKPRTRASSVRGKPWSDRTGLGQLGFALPIAILIAVVLIIAGGAGYYLYKTSQEQEEAEVVKPEQVIDETADWEVYQNEKYGFEIKYPKDWKIVNVDRTAGREYVQFLSPLINNKYYFVLNFGARNKGDNTQISYQPDEDWELLKSLMRLGDKVKIGNVDVLTTEIVEKGKVHSILYFNRLGAGRIEISGLEIQANSGFIEGLQHLSASDVESIDLKNLPELKLANQILSTFKFLEPDETADWKIYRNEEYGFELKYPKEWREPLETKPPYPAEGVLYLYLVGFYKSTGPEGFEVAIYGKRSDLDYAGVDEGVGLPQKGKKIPEVCPKPTREVSIGVENYPAKIVYVSPEDVCFRETYFYIFQKGNYNYILTPMPNGIGYVGYDGKAETEKHLPEFYQILSTFKFLEEPPPSAGQAEPELEPVPAPEPEPEPIPPEPPDRPVLNDPGDSVRPQEESEAFKSGGVWSDPGRYKINWQTVEGAIGYVLQEDTSLSFNKTRTLLNVTGGPRNYQEIGIPIVSSPTVFYYRVKAVNKYGESPWSNIVDIEVLLPLPSITVNTPNGGEMLKRGETVRIFWDSNGVDAVQIKARNAETGREFIITEFTASKPSYYDWIIPPDLILGDKYEIQIIDSNNFQVSDWSNKYFRIVSQSTLPKTITLTSPNGGEIWRAGDAYRITWDSVEVEFVKISILYPSTSGGFSLDRITPGPISLSISAAQGYYTWTIPTDIRWLPRDGGDNYKIRINDAGTDSILDESDDFFSIINP